VTTEPFWPGDKPAPQEAGEADEAVQVEETAGGETQVFSVNGDEPLTETEPAADEAVEEAEEAEESTGSQEALAEPEPVPSPAEVEPEPGPEAEPAPPAVAADHAPGALRVPDGIGVLEGVASGPGRSVGVVVARFNGEVTGRLLKSSLAALDAADVPREQITVVPVPGAFELPLAAMGLAKSRRYACVVALGCVIRGETAHFDYVAGEAASGLQLAALETGIPVAFGVLTVDTLEQAMARTDKGAEAVSSALEMADLFSQLRAHRA
jgi:6,7-dimethyl-8-ribityllumazine synthase